MNNFERETVSRYIVCHNCSYDANEKYFTQCEVCGNSLVSPSEITKSAEPEPNRRSNLKLEYSIFKKPKFLLSVLLLLVFGGVIYFYISRSTTNTKEQIAESNSRTRQELQRITLLGDTFSGYSTFRDRRFQEQLEKVGLDLNYRDEFSRARQAKLLNIGKAELIVTTLDRFLRDRPQGKIVGILNRSVGADAIVLNTLKYPNLKSLVDLATLVKSGDGANEPSMVYAGDTSSEYLALVLNTQFDSFNIADFNIREVADASDAWKLLKNSQENIAVAVLWEPYVTEAEQQGYTVALSSKDAPKSIINVIVASDRVLESQPKTISKFLTAYYRVIDANVREPSYLKQQIAEDGNLTSDRALAVLEGIDFFTAIEARNWLEDGILAQRINSIAATLVLTGRMSQIPPNPQNLFVSQFVNEAASNTETSIDLVRTDNPELAEKLAGKQTTVSVPQVSAKEIEQAPDIGNLQVRGEVLFNDGSATLTPQSHKTLDKLAQEISEFNERTVGIVVVGHTSKSGSATANLELSRYRAQVVARSLRDRGLKHKIVAEGKGFYLPLSNMSPEDPRQQRTEIRLVRIE